MPKKILYSIFFIIVLLTLPYIWLLQSKINAVKKEVGLLNRQKSGFLKELQLEKNNFAKISQVYRLLNDQFRESQEDLAKINQEFQEAQKTIERLNSQVSVMSVLRAENEYAHSQNQQLEERLKDTLMQRDELKFRLSSVSELRKALKDLKNRRKKEIEDVVSWTKELEQPQVPKPEEKTKASRKKSVAKQKRAPAGNRGYVYKNGKPTYQPGVKIEVEPF